MLIGRGSVGMVRLIFVAAKIRIGELGVDFSATGVIIHNRRIHIEAILIFVIIHISINHLVGVLKHRAESTG
jgi:hypothetical protein